MVTIKGGPRDARLAAQKEAAEKAEEVPKSLPEPKVDPPKAIICRCGCDSCDGTEDCECEDCCEDCACED